MSHPRPRIRITAAAALIALATSLTGGGVAVAAPADRPPADAPPSTTTRDDVVAREPSALFHEDFETGAGADPVLLERYEGAEGMRYTADPYWLAPAQCNGIVTGAGVRDQSGCPDNRPIRRLAAALGALTPEGVDGNHALSAYTKYAPPSADRVQLRTVRPISIPGGERYVSFGVSTAATACDLAAPLLSFSLLDGAEVRPAFDEPIDACAAADTSTVVVDGATVRVGQHVSGGGLLFGGTDAGVLLENEQRSGSGNDAAVDEITILDSTPSLAYWFAGGDHLVGDAVPFTTSVVNTTEKGAKAGWAFRTELPEGTRPADGAVPRSSCDVDRAELVDGELVVEGDLRRGEASCDITLDVVADAAGAHAIGADAVTSSRGVLDPADATLVLQPEQNLLPAVGHARVSGSDDVADLGEQVVVDLDVVDGGNVAVHDLAVAGASCPVERLAVGAGTTCSTPPHEVTQRDLDRGHIAVDLRATALSRLGAPVASELVTVRVPTTAAAPAIALELSHDAADEPVVGDLVTVTGAVVNTGTVTLDELGVEQTGPAATAFRCPVAELAPGAATECTTTVAIDQAVVDAGDLALTAAASGRSPAGAVVTDAASTTVDVPEHPALGADAVLALGGDAERPAAGDPVGLRVDVVNDGTVTLREVAARLAGDGGAALVCPVAELAPGARTQCSLDLPLAQAEVDAGRVARDVVVTARSAQGTGVTERRHVEAPVALAPALAATATAERAGERPLVGDELVVEVHAENIGTATLHALTVRSERDGLPFTCAPGELAPGASATCTATLVVTQADLDAGRVDLPLTVTGLAPDDTAVTRPTSAEVVLPTSSTLSAEAAAALVGDAQRPVAGDPVEIEATVTNTGTTSLADLSASSAQVSGAWTCDDAALAPGASTRCHAEAELTQERLDAGSVGYVVDVRAAGPAGAAVTAQDDVVVELPSRPSLEATAVVSGQQGDRAPVAGSATTVTTTVVNTGTTTLDAFSVATHAADLAGDAAGPVAGAGAPCWPTRLAPGAEGTCTTVGPEVTQDDVESGRFEVVVDVRATDPHATAVTATTTAGLDLPARPALSLEVRPVTLRDGTALDAGRAARPGDEVAVQYVLRNEGDLVVDGVSVDDGLGEVSCPVTLLLPGQAVECRLVEPHLVDDADAAAGALHLSSRGGGSVARPESPEATAERVLVPRVERVERPVRIHTLLLRRTLPVERAPLAAPPLPTPRVLAFTGASIGLLVALGLGLVGAGSTVRARSRGTS